jgi:hypothetical protein
MLSNKDIYHAAKRVLNQRGEAAATYAARRKELLLVEGDLARSRDWRRILSAIEELHRGRREGGAVN